MYRIRVNQDPLPVYFNDYDYSPVEHLIINARFPHGALHNLLFCFPKLHRLQIDHLVRSRHVGSEYPIRLLKNFKHVSLKLYLITFNEIEKTVQNFFRHVEVFRISTQYDEAYLNAKRWEDLITFSMPNLRIFDIYHDGFVSDNQSTYHDLIAQFASSFWITKRWFFTHQHNWLERLNSGVFYSTQPYRRKDFSFYWQLNEQICPYVQETSLNTVKYVHICGTKANNNPAVYFPNATELTIRHCFTTPTDSLVQTLNRIVRLEQLTKLVIENWHLVFVDLIDVLHFTPNLHTFKCSSLDLHDTNSTLNGPNDNWKCTPDTNQIKNLDLGQDYTFKNVQLILDLFPQLESLKVGMKSKEIKLIVQYLLLNRNNKTPHLFFLCISETSVIYLKELTVMIEENKLLHDYFIKFVNRDLYLWW